MDYKNRKVIDGIREGLLLCQEHKIKLLGNPYASLGQEPDYKQLNIDAEMIYNHLKLMEVI